MGTVPPASGSESEPAGVALPPEPGFSDEESAAEEFSPFHLEVPDLDEDPMGALEAVEREVEGYLNGTHQPPPPQAEVAPPSPAETVASEAPAPVETPPIEPPETDDRAPQYRLRPRTRDDQRAFDLMKADPLLSLEEALAKVKGTAAAPPTAQPEAAPAPESQEEAPPAQTVDDLRQEIFALRREEIEARKDYDADKEAEIATRILELEMMIPEVQAAEASRAAAEQLAEQQWVQHARAVSAEVNRDYPEAADPNSAFARRMQEIDDIWADIGDPRYNDPAKARVIADLVAREQGYRAQPQGNSSPIQQPSSSAIPAPPAAAAPAVSGPAPVQPTASTPRPPVPPLGPASGAARTQPAPALQQRIADAISAADTPEALDALTERLYGSAG